jgi:uncharacterized protein YndB with AHSA1/START domain
MSEEIMYPENITYWIITNGTDYGDGVTGVNQVTTVGNGWTIYWQGTNYEEYLVQCENVNIVPEISLAS